MHINSTILSGQGVLKDLYFLLKDRKHVLFITDQNIINLSVTKELIKKVQENVALVTIVDDIPPEPSHHDVTNLLNKMKVSNADLVIGVGGGSVLDVAKLISVLCIKDSNITLEQLLDGQKPTRRCTSILIPTTAGTGSEATPNAILAIPEKDTKQGIISPVMLPDYVCLVPELTTSMPNHIAASTGIDALCHLIECFTANISNPIGDNYALIGMQKLFNSLEKSVNDKTNIETKLNMLWASYYGGAAIAHAGTHLVHAMSYPLGGKYHIPHGVANAILLVPCMEFVRDAVVDKFAQAYDLLPDAVLTLTAEEKSHALVNYFRELVKRLALPCKLQELNISSDDLHYLVDAALDVKRLMNNVPKQVSKQDVLAIYRSLL
ncbi:iron-containing alcohol dehydrogenase [Gilliamella sp. B3464]|uniref:iron-containing alcohol dehydrogenase n=1 Tax=unclassified Gilliamella TaxID=2685620 RepID=UPI00226A7397|nr:MULTISPECIES: iron-containing alcohol dehydrogenase [unclassified Gilliamella]MCX8711546.1 iron-containing alcohol dehydrogenase [Gilliamella sp. B3468]MCX8738247.1 iron-containing alcohol dehydrogenase [Gilliamella sp. B2824]MCX8750553.1 iron-containing alcohol dehydrogenase [Gilliamella sp. B3464]